MRKNAGKYDVFVVDDDKGMHKTASETLGDMGCSVTCFENGLECLDQLQKQNCDLLITAVKMRHVDGFRILKEVKRRVPRIPVVVVITSFSDIPMSVKALKLGAVDLIEKPLDPHALVQKVNIILKKEEPVFVPTRYSFTKPERKVLKLVLQGKNNKEIADVTKHALRTIERHRCDIMQKFDVDNMVDLIKKAALTDIDDIK